ncbi:hypothetical protein SASPL_108817 [Salvia splendens]|uniref:Uncharacterized protein n=1 Tax=Salvia splendens TaxID=180675 RepID=A0A8X8YFE4_SALSN|nr:uncharacterized protein LOC121796854 [Salvia splendens]KAG6430744.1 hypothetical protein SASPL_108817 [Salvia splendens]
MASISREEKSFKITPENDKLFSKLLSRESSFRVYYGAAPSAVPFVWETRPGTPKHNSAANSEIPPLKPPPSYFTAGIAKSAGGGSRSKLLLHSLFRRMNPKRAAAVSHSSSTSSSSSQSDPISTPAHVRRRRRASSFGSSFDERADDLRSSRICLGIGGGGSSVKRALLSIVGR